MKQRSSLCDEVRGAAPDRRRGRGSISGSLCRRKLGRRRRRHCPHDHGWISHGICILLHALLRPARSWGAAGASRRVQNRSAKASDGTRRPSGRAPRARRQLANMSWSVDRTNQVGGVVWLGPCPWTARCWARRRRGGSHRSHVVPLGRVPPPATPWEGPVCGGAGGGGCSGSGGESPGDEVDMSRYKSSLGRPKDKHDTRACRPDLPQSRTGY